VTRLDCAASRPGGDVAGVSADAVLRPRPPRHFPRGGQGQGATGAAV
jgi:hypothetical protein